MPNAEASCQLYVVVEAGEAAPDRLAAAFSAAAIASVLIVAPAGRVLEAAAARPLVEQSRSLGAAALVLNDAQLARTVGADGVHIAAPVPGSASDLAEVYRAARSVLGAGGVIGVDAAISRHDAMTVAEAGADYVAFGAPTHLKDRDKARARRSELVAWWAEIFQVPCVAFDVGNAGEAEELAAAGADFLAVALSAGMPPAAARDLVRACAQAVRVQAPAP